MALDEACAAELATLSLADLPRRQSPTASKGSDLSINVTEISDSDEEADVHRVCGTKGKSVGPSYKCSTGPECLSCGGDHQRTTCKFRDAICRCCGRWGHIARVCQSAQPQAAAQFPVFSDVRRPPNPSTYRPRTDRRSSEIHMVAHPGKQKIHLTVHIEGKPCVMEVDTGSATSIVSWSTLKWLVPSMSKRRLSPCDLFLRDYQHNSIPVAGCGDFRVNFKEFSGRLPLIVVDGPLPSLLGLNWFDALGLTSKGYMRSTLLK